MKKFLSIFLTLIFIVTATVPVMAENEDGEFAFEDTIALNEVEHSIEAYRAVGNKTVIPGSTTPNDKMAWYVTPSGATQKINTQSTILSAKQNLVVAKFPIPEAKPGKILDRYIIQFIAQDTSGSAISVLKLEGTDYDFSTLTSKDERIQTVLSNISVYDATDHAVISEPHETLNSIYRNFADVTTYAQECAAKGQKYFYVIVGCTRSTRNMMFNVTWSEYIKNDTYHAYYYNYVSEFPFELVDETVHGGEEAFPSDGELSWEFTNDVMDFSAKANGKDLKISIDGTKASIDEPLEEITGYELTIEARDQWDEVITKTYKFFTGFKTGATGPENPTLGVYDTKIAIEELGGTYNIMELSFYLLTQFDNPAEALAVRDSEGNDAGVEFIYYDYNQKYDITEPVELKDDTAYEFVMKAGVTDKYGNALEEDLVITKFYAGETPEEKGFTGEDSLSIGLDLENSKIVVDFENSVYVNRYVDILITEEGAVVYNETFLTNKNGIMDTVEIPLEKGKYVVTVRPENAPDCYGESFIFCSDDDIKNLWKTVAVDGKSEKIIEDWEYIAYTFGFENKYTDQISDMETFAGKIIEYRKLGALTEDITEDNLIEMDNRVYNASYFTVLESSTDIEKTKELIADVEDTLEKNYKEIYDLWKKAIASKYANATVQAFIDTANKNFFGVENVADAMDKAVDVYKCGVILDRIADPANKTEVEQILSVEENFEILGIADFAERYNALGNKSALTDAISNKEYADRDAFAVAFENALKEAESSGGSGNNNGASSRPQSNPPSSSSSKGSSHSTTGTQFMSSIPSSVTPFVPFTDIENVSWAKEHIIKLYSAGVINGKTATQFAPGDNITREEFTKLIVSMAKLAANSYSIAFSDVASDAWYANYVNAAYANGVVGGIGGGLFGTGYNATRQDIAVMIVNALKAKGVQITSEAANFGDNAAIADYAMNAVAFLNAKGVLTGDANANFNPTANATRAEVAVMLSRVNDIFMKEVK